MWSKRPTIWTIIKNENYFFIGCWIIYLMGFIAGIAGMNVFSINMSTFRHLYISFSISFVPWLIAYIYCIKRAYRNALCEYKEDLKIQRNMNRLRREYIKRFNIHATDLQHYQ